MQVIDFRARPNTKEYMRLYPSSAWELFFDCPRPEDEPLSSFITALDKASVSYGVFTGRQTPQLRLSNDYVSECIHEYPDRLFGFAGIDATEGVGALREIERAITELGMKGVCLDPYNAQVYPDDRLYYPLYYKCLELAVPVILTMGPLVGKWSNPASVHNVAVDLPELEIVCSHGVWPQVTELIALAYRHQNVYLEASIYEFLPGSAPLFEAANGILQDKVIYASGFPFRPLDDLQRFLEYPFDNDVVDKLVYRNAARLLRIAS